jgi:hypothetical protein
MASGLAVARLPFLSHGMGSVSCLEANPGAEAEPVSGSSRPGGSPG